MHYFNFSPSSVSDWLQTIIAVLALIFAGFQLYKTRKWDIQNATFQYIDKLISSVQNSDPELINKIGLLKYDAPVLTKNSFEKLLENQETRQALYYISYCYESFSVAILSGYLNIKIVRRLYFKNFLNAYDKLEPYIKIRMEESNNDGLFHHFRKVASQWKKDGSNHYKPNEY